MSFAVFFFSLYAVYPILCYVFLPFLIVDTGIQHHCSLLSLYLMETPGICSLVLLKEQGSHLKVALCSSSLCTLAKTQCFLVLPSNFQSQTSPPKPQLLAWNDNIRDISCHGYTQREYNKMKENNFNLLCDFTDHSRFHWGLINIKRQQSMTPVKFEPRTSLLLVYSANLYAIILTIESL